jgi:hypothetical protein
VSATVNYWFRERRVIASLAELVEMGSAAWNYELTVNTISETTNVNIILVLKTLGGINFQDGDVTRE